MCLSQKREREFDDYIHEKFVQAKADFRELLKETKLITYRSQALMTESEQHLKDVEKILQVGIAPWSGSRTLLFVT